MATEDNVIFRYSDQQAVDDGVLIACLSAAGHDTHHRITRHAFTTLREYFRPTYPKYTDGEFLAFFFAELLPLVTRARQIWEGNLGGDVLKTTYAFRATSGPKDVIWLVPNEVGGITMMLPEDY